MNLGQFTEIRLLVPRLLGESQGDVIQELASRLHRAERIGDPGDFFAPVLEREAATPTLIGEGVALPHARGGAVLKLSLSVGISQRGIPWPDRNSVVHVVFLAAIPLAQTQAYLVLLAGLSRLIQSEAAMETLTDSIRPEQMLAVFETVPITAPSARPLQQ